MQYYVYTHSTPEGSVFYVGKGKDKRAFSTSDRSLKWRDIVHANDGLTIKIVKRFETEDEAFDYERQLIAECKHAGADLVNYTSGGKGTKDYCVSESVRQLKSKQMKGYKHKEIACPHCGTTGGETSLKRWHFENCKGTRPQFKARITVLGTRHYLGKFHTKEEADANAQDFKDLVMSEVALLNTVTVPSGSRWIIV